MTFPAFTVARLPKIVFGEGRITEVPKEVAALGRQCLLVIGARSLRGGPFWQALADGFAREGVAVDILAVDGEPSPERVDEAVARFQGAGIDVVAAVGGGSVLDAAKAIAGLLLPGNSVMDHLEGVGRGVPYRGSALPFVAVPTTAGTGSEATKNAVLSRVGPDGFKKSFRHDDLVARVAVIDPALLSTCPRHVLAANGMDAFTQLLESYTSTGANSFTDALAWSGLEAFRDGFFAALDGDPEGRARLAYAALLSGICLAQTGLGAVHGLASPLGAWFPIPHGVACGTLVAEATEVNLRALAARRPDSPAAGKYARVGALLSGHESGAILVETLRDWTGRLDIDRLGAYGVGEGDIARLVAASGGNSMKTNPLVLEPGEIAEIVRRRL
ncbi:MAG TPA: iron-containing alcohol dehydrogenase [Azospirillaceae bacterium]|nr:iron-containing alcohol dehydrogenase [Azospirillaceae bacterium]